MNRRHFIKIASAAGGGLAISGYFASGLAGASKLDSSVRRMEIPWFVGRINPDNTLTLTIAKHEMGQGTSDNVAMAFIEELGIDWEKIHIERASWDGETTETYLEFFKISTGGSWGTLSCWDGMLKAGATLRELLISAAAAEWKIDRSHCYTESGCVKRKDSKDALTFFELALPASKLPIPEDIPLKDKKDYKVIGQPLRSHRIKKMVTGRIDYGSNKKLPGMVYAMIERSPVYRGSVASFDASKAKATPGVLDVFKTDHSSGIVVIADSTWAAMQGRKALEIEWDDGVHGAASLETLRAEARKNFQTPGEPLYDSGRTEAAFSKAATLYESTFESGLQPHLAMEPLNATAHYQDGKLDIWAGCQLPTIARYWIGKVVDIPEENIALHDVVSGGSFGRRLNGDFSIEAAAIAKKIGKPVKLVWTREDTTRHDKYHPFKPIKIEAALDEEKLPYAIRLHQTHKEGEAGPNPPYHAPYVSIRLHSRTPITPEGAWRSVDIHPRVFAVESFYDELAYNAGIDPYQFRLDLLNRRSSEDDKERIEIERFRQVLKTAAEKAQWGKKLPKGRGQGIAIGRFGETYVGHVAEVSVSNSSYTVHKITAAVHCGHVFNPQVVRGQIEGGIIFGLTALQYGGIDIEKGRPMQSNFHDARVYRMGEDPEMDIHLLEGEGPVGGMGEPPVPPVAPAVLNAIFAASNIRIRSIPARNPIASSNA